MNKRVRFQAVKNLPEGTSGPELSRIIQAGRDSLKASGFTAVMDVDVEPCLPMGTLDPAFGDEETVLLKRGNYEVRCPAFPKAAEYVRVVRISDMQEVVYWDRAEWQEDGEECECIGAIFGIMSQVMSGAPASAIECCSSIQPEKADAKKCPKCNGDGMAVKENWTGRGSSMERCPLCNPIQPPAPPVPAAKPWKFRALRKGTRVMCRKPIADGHTEIKHGSVVRFERKELSDAYLVKLDGVRKPVYFHRDDVQKAPKGV